MRAGHRQRDAGKTPAVETPKKSKDAPVVGKINPKTEPEDEMDDADDPTEDMTEDAADGGDGDDEDPMLASPDVTEKRKNKKSPAR